MDAWLHVQDLFFVLLIFFISLKIATGTKIVKNMFFLYFFISFRPAIFFITVDFQYVSLVVLYVDPRVWCHIQGFHMHAHSDSDSRHADEPCGRTDGASPAKLSSAQPASPKPFLFGFYFGPNRIASRCDKSAR